MKGPHFFEKRKKEMARQEKVKQKAERKAQRKAEKDRGEGGEASDEVDELADLPHEGALVSGETETGSGTPTDSAPALSGDDGQRRDGQGRDA